MAGRQWRDFRSGNWNEEFGILMLKAFAAVAPVPRQEDFGLDAIATLLRDDEEYVYAEDSFYVQLKSDSVKKIVYKDQEVRWLKNLQLPFFIGQVNRADSSLRLFPGHKLNELLLSRGDFKEVHVRLCVQGNKKRVIQKDRVDVFLGLPLLAFTVQQAATRDFVDFAYGILKHYVVAEQRNVICRAIKFCRSIEWTTNETPTVNRGHFVALSRPPNSDFQRTVESLVPGFHALALHASATKNRAEIKALVALVRELKTAGFDFDALDEFEDELAEWKPPKPFFDDL